jgi:hypothetical protein
MSKIVEATSEKGKGKGVDAVETDVIEVIPVGANRKYPQGVIRLYECKIGLGKPEGRGKAGESLQLMKAKRLLSKFWIANKGTPPPPIECYFLAWKYGEVGGNLGVAPINTSTNQPNNPIKFTHHRIPYPEISKALRAAAGENDANQANNSTNKLSHWDDVKTLDPGQFATLTGLKSNFVQAYLDGHRGDMLADFSRLMQTLIKRGAPWGLISENARRALAVQRNFVSGPGLSEVPPQEPQNVFELRLKGNLGNYMNRWNLSFYNHMKNARLKQQTINAAKNYMGTKAMRAVKRLQEQGKINFTTGVGTKIKNLPAFSASELGRATNSSNTRKFTNNKNINEYLKRVQVAISRANNILSNNRKPIFKGAKVEILNKKAKQPNVGGSSRVEALIKMREKAYDVANANARKFDAAYMKFLRDHARNGLGGTQNNRRQAVYNALNQLAREAGANGRNENANYYERRKGIITGEL